MRYTRITYRAILEFRRVYLNIVLFGKKLIFCATLNLPYGILVEYRIFAFKPRTRQRTMFRISKTHPLAAPLFNVSLSRVMVFPFKVNGFLRDSDNFLRVPTSGGCSVATVRRMVWNDWLFEEEGEVNTLPKRKAYSVKIEYTNRLCWFYLFI